MLLLKELRHVPAVGEDLAVLDGHNEAVAAYGLARLSTVRDTEGAIMAGLINGPSQSGP